MSQATSVNDLTGPTPSPGSLRSTLAKLSSVWSDLDIDGRMLGMVGALGIIWVAFNIMSNGTYLTARNLWFLSVQSTSIAIMATGMVLIIVSRNIDLSVGSLLGLLAYVMGAVQSIWIPTSLGLRFDQPYTWIVALAIGLALGALIGTLQGVIIAYGRVPAFIVTLGGFLIWRGLIFHVGDLPQVFNVGDLKGGTIGPMDKTFALMGGQLPRGALGDMWSWAIGILACVAVVYISFSRRRQRRKYGFPVRPLVFEIAIPVVSCATILGAVWVANNYYLAPLLAHQYALDHHIPEPPGGLNVPVGIAIPVVILLGVTVVMWVVANRLRFGRYVWALGGNPEAAELGGINVRLTVVKTYTLMGILVAISAAVAAARGNYATTNLGVQNELDVIAAAVIGGTSFTGGVGSIPGAILGAVVMQSLRSGMSILNVDSPAQDIIVGVVLVAAVGLDTITRRRVER